MLPLLLEVILPFLKKTAKYWIVAIAVVALTWYVHHRYNEFVANVQNISYHKGYADAEGLYSSQMKAIELDFQADQIQQQKNFEKATAEAEDATRKVTANANALATKAEQDAEKQRSLNRSLQKQLTEAIDHVPLTSTLSSSDHPFSAGFVGLFNLATKGELRFNPDGSASRDISPADISQASFVNGGSASLGLAQPTQVTMKDLLSVVQYNMNIANQCISDRKAMKDYINGLCLKGFCQ